MCPCTRVLLFYIPINRATGQRIQDLHSVANAQNRLVLRHRRLQVVAVGRGPHRIERPQIVGQRSHKSISHRRAAGNDQPVHALKNVYLGVFRHHRKEHRDATCGFYGQGISAREPLLVLLVGGCDSDSRHQGAHRLVEKHVARYGEELFVQEYYQEQAQRVAPNADICVCLLVYTIYPMRSPSMSFPLRLTVHGQTFCLRPITPDDRERVRKGLEQISEETSYHRFFTPHFSPNDAHLRYLTEVDGDQHVALGLVDCDRSGQPGVGAARYVRVSDEPTVAEAAILVIDRYQDQGLGSILLAALSRYAVHHGVERFRAYVLQDNTAFLDYLHGLGGVEEHAQEGMMVMEMPVRATAEDLPPTEAAARARWAATCLDRAEPGGCPEEA